MELTPLEIKQQKFEKTFRGLDPSEVQSFLNVVSSEWEHLSTKNRELEQKVEELQDKIAHYERVEEALHETLEAAKATVDTKLSGARKEAKHTIVEAEMEAESIVQEAVVEREKVRQDIHRLLDRRKEIVGGLRSYLNVSLESVDHFAKDDAGRFDFDEEDTRSRNLPQLVTEDSDEEDDEQKASKMPGSEDIDDLVDDLE